MFTPSEKIFVVYEKPEAAEPTDRVELLREGFSFWAFVLNLPWLVAKRLWWVLAAYFVASVALMLVGEALHLSQSSLLMLQLLLQLLLAYHAYDLQGWVLRRRGYRMAGVLVAESKMHATRRYYDYAR